ncbi:hypothetical protein [Pectobacterium quasiaquaticum]|uniref:hypothetical protein n=1 Tax=Pectobacterium quasiaquaticum TaxID=2774015 RepID=UPI001873F3CF|nr:hypothetical protein [Pectobacterium quasiaquaticum]MBE5222053.1 hypothetical protein [Pectobacterium quasiaquaticum]
MYDLFHVVAKFGREVIDRVRGDQANQPTGHEVKLAELLEPLNTVYMMKTALKELWYASDKDVAQRRWNE